jgi:hypothetical protein
VLAQRGTMDSSAPSPSRRSTSTTSQDACQYELTLNETSRSRCFHMIVKGAIVQGGNRLLLEFILFFRSETFLPSAGRLKRLYFVVCKGSPHPFGKVPSQKRRSKVAFRFLRIEKLRLSPISEGFVNR